jgi:hypothetical protein
MCIESKSKKGLKVDEVVTFWLREDTTAEEKEIT